MARREIFVDDFDGKEHDDIETRHFVVGHQAFTIDLSAKNYEQFLADMEKWMSLATPLAASRGSSSPAQTRTRAPRGTGTPVGAKAPVTEKGHNADYVREWLRANDFGNLVKGTGRLAAEAIARYNEGTDNADDQYIGAKAAAEQGIKAAE